MTHLEEILHEFAVAEDVPSRELLEEFCENYPQYANELTELAIHLVMDALLSARDAEMDE